MKPWYQLKNLSDDHAELWIYEQIGEDWWTGEGVTAKQFAKDMAALKATSIDMHINSPGGDVWDGQAIFNAIANHPAYVTTYIDGLAASIASVIALAGDKVVMAENALFMIHNPYGGVMGTAAEMRQMADVLDKVRDTIVGVYAKHSALTDEELVAAMDAETWFSASEAREAGFVDEVGAELKLAACFDLTRFKHPPVTALAPSNEDIEDAGGAPVPSSESGGSPSKNVVATSSFIRRKKA
jgi:ATP-dependent Clp endopeptidase proteolytic subunit ClpP